MFNISIFRKFKINFLFFWKYFLFFQFSQQIQMRHHFCNKKRFVFYISQYPLIYLKKNIVSDHSINE